MPSNYTPLTASWPTTIQIPSDGDDADAASVAAAIQALGDRTQIIHDGRSYLAPASLSGSQVDYGPAGWVDATMVLLTASAAFTFHGLIAGARKTLVNTSVYECTIAHESGTEATVTRRVICPNAEAFVLGPGCAVDIAYDDAASKWRVCSSVNTSGDFAWSGSHIFNGGGGGETLRVGTNGGILTEDLAGDTVSVNAHYSDMLQNANWSVIFAAGSDTTGLVSAGGGGFGMFLELAKNVPSNAKLESVRVRFQPGDAVATAGNRMQFALYTRTTGASSFTGPKTTALVNLTGVDTLADNGTASQQDLTLTLATPQDVDRSSLNSTTGGFWSIFLYVRGSTSGAGTCAVYDIAQNFKVKSYNPY